MSSKPLRAGYCLRVGEEEEICVWQGIWVLHFMLLLGSETFPLQTVPSTHQVGENLAHYFTLRRPWCILP